MASDRAAFETAMVAAGYSNPERASGPGSGYLYQRDEDRFVGWSLASHTGEAEPVAWQVRWNVGRSFTAWTETPEWKIKERIAGFPAGTFEHRPLYATPPAATPAAPGEVNEAAERAAFRKEFPDEPAQFLDWAWHGWKARAAIIPREVHGAWSLLKDQRADEAFAALSKLVGHSGGASATNAVLVDRFLMNSLQEWFDDLAQSNFDGYVQQGVFTEASEFAKRIEAAALSHPAPVAAPASVPQAIDQLVSTLAESKGWMRDYARALIEDAIDRRHLEVAAPAPASEAVEPPAAREEAMLAALRTARQHVYNNTGSASPQWLRTQATFDLQLIDEAITKASK
jgi:hypothetical protein